jgi:hypothetical protein
MLGTEAMTIQLRELVPPHPFRQRIVDPNFYHENQFMLNNLLSEIQGIAQSMWESTAPLALAWTEQIVQCQNELLLPVIHEELFPAVQIGIAASIHEERNLKIIDGKTSYNYHSILGIMAFSEDVRTAIVNTLLIDGGYYLYRTKLAPDALGAAMRQTF